MSGTAPTTPRDQLVADAKSLPDLIAKAQAVDPALASQLTPKALAASKTPWGVVAGYAVTWLVSHYGLGWDADTCALVAGVAVLLGSYAMRYVTSSPIGGWFKAKADPTSAKAA